MDCENVKKENKMLMNHNHKIKNEEIKLIEYKTKLTKKQILICIIGGLLVGFINGFLGGGGGMLVVPLLTLLLKMEDKKAHATALLIIFPLSLCSSIIYMIENPLDYMQVLYSGIGFVVGGIIGALILKKINNKVLRIIFSVVMIIAGIKMIF